MSTETLAESTSHPHDGHAPHGKHAPKHRVSPVVKRRIFTGIAIAIGIFCIWFLYDYWAHEETDNAYVTGHMHYVAPRISGVVEQVLVEDNQFVRAGDVLVRIDPRDQQALFDEAKANADKAQQDFDRNKELFAINAVSKQDFEHAQSNLGVAQSRLETARLQLSYATIVAPSDGTVGRKNVEVGNRVQPGQTLMVVVEPKVWIIANFKETQLHGMKIGSKVHLTIDAIPGEDFTGTIDSFSPASGNQFALLPADNATGNFTKIAQRLPVKIVFDAESLKRFEDRVRPGLSVVVKIRIH